MEFRKHFKRLEHIGAKLVRLTKAYCFLEVLLSQKGRRHMAIGAVILSAHTTRRVIMTVATREMSSRLLMKSSVIAMRMTWSFLINLPRTYNMMMIRMSLVKKCWGTGSGHTSPE